ncbi:hypothetical protein JOQ06_027133 [Pogonophryne albipinna]|uniref:5-hydroxytryptamine receptor 3A-like n=1 Tax=Pogonophryne albipinna TaxID=1090488 RepID=A0AAD6FMH7_9TELE|nr:hypothetical protein JOQ06_027133 [Pogonophryne albipinna]
MLTGFIFLLFLTDGVLPENNCSYQDVLNHLQLTKTNELYSMTRPVKNYKRPTRVSLEVLLYAILDVVEKDQKFIPYVWTVMRWHNEYISWDPNQTEKDKAPPSLYLTINDKGDVEVQNDQVLVSTCRMHIYKFPFDIQNCNLSFKSIIHTAKDIRLQPSDNSTEATEWSRDVMRTQYEWLFLNMTVTTNNARDLISQDIIIYTITMKRRSLLYIVNFLVPVLFFLCLDLASFLISDSGGEKLSFKVTVLLAITVLQLILNEILPASSNRIPLIAVYCIGIFALMLLSLLETILVMHLMEKDSQASQDNKADNGQSKDCNKRGKANFHNSHQEGNEWTQSGCIYDVCETPSELLPVTKEGNSRKVIEEYHALEKLSDELREMQKTLSLLLSNTKEVAKPGYWTRVAKKKWEDPHIYWKPDHFGDLDKMRLPADMLWKPDVMIEEMIEKDKAVPNAFVTINSNGFVEYVRNLMVVSTCKMQVYKFPFDIQSCNLSLKSIDYPEEELKFQAIENSTVVTEWTRQMMRNQFEWLFISMTVKNTSVPHFDQNHNVVIYTIRMRRRSALYIANFLVPILFFFGLNLASFLISDYGGEKLSFKVTVLLAVTVMQLILNEILPSSSDRIPLIAVYCIGMFGLIMISLLETILVMYLIEKDSASKEKKADKNRSLSEDYGDKQGNYDGDVKKWTHCACVCNVSDEPPSVLLSVAKEDKRSQLMEESNSLEKLPDELSEAVKALSLLLSRKEERKPDYWTKVAKKWDIIFFFVYVTVSAVFLAVIFSVWINAKDE